MVSSPVQMPTTVPADDIPSTSLKMGGTLAAWLLALLLLSGCGGTGSDSAPEPGPSGRVAGAPESPPKAGRWHRAPGRQAGTLDQAQQREIERLEAIGYVDGSRDAVSVTGVTLFRKNLAGKGYNLYVSGHGPEAILMDMEGRVLHRWRYSCEDIWPDPDEPYAPRKGKSQPGKTKKMADPGSDVDFFRNAHLFPNGDLLAIFEGRGLVKLDKHSNLIWASRCGAHHDLDLRENGDILVLTREARINPLVSADRPILEDFIITIGAGGEVKSRVSMLECFAAAPQFVGIWRSSENETGDLFHTNTLFLLREPPRGAPPAFTAGRVLTAMRTLHAVAVVDLEEEKVVWARTGRFRAMHDPSLLTNGNLLLFDNCGVPSRSRILEFDLERWQPDWSYVGTPGRPFFSETCGTCQRLGNGNTLITESDGGRAFEVTPGGEVVWEFFNPHRAGDHDQFIASLFTVKRLDSGFMLDWIP